MEAKATNMIKRDLRMESYIAKGMSILKERGVEINITAKEVFSSSAKPILRKKKEPLVIPSPSEIINGKSPMGIPNN
jgi:hypothetical protein